jgi:hypothetical protein
VVDLVGSSMAALVQAIPVTMRRTGRPVVVVGGLAVVCRLSRPYRATSDLDVVSRRARGDIPQLDLLLASGARSSGVSGALVPTESGPVQVDVLEVTDAELDELPDDPTDRLHVMSHAWAAVTASPVSLRAEGTDEVTVAIAEPGPLIAMKLQSIMNRGRQKEVTDLLDIIRLSLDAIAGPASRTALENADKQLREDALLHARLWFIERADRTLRLVRAAPEGRDTDPDDVRLVGELLHSVLESTRSD